MPVVPPRPFPVTSGPSLVRADRAGKKGRGCRQAGRARRNSTRRGNGGAARKAALRAYFRPGRPCDRFGAVAAPATRAYPGDRPAQSGDHRRRRTIDPTAGPGGGCQRVAESARGAASRRATRAHGIGARSFATHDSVSRRACPAGTTPRHHRDSVRAERAWRSRGKHCGAAS